MSRTQLRIPLAVAVLVCWSSSPANGQSESVPVAPPSASSIGSAGEMSDFVSAESDSADSSTFLEPLVEPAEIFGDHWQILPSSHLQPRPLLVPQREVTPELRLPPTDTSLLSDSRIMGAGLGRNLAAGSGRLRGVATTSVPGTEALARSATDSGSLLDRSPMVLGVGVQRRTPIVTDPRVRGSRVGTLAASGSYWVPARMDLDTMLSKIDSRSISDITVVKGPYSSRYGPGSNFVDVELLTSPRYDGEEIHGTTSGDYSSNGEQYCGRQTVSGGDFQSGFRIGYGNKGGSSYQSGDGTSMPAGYHSEDFDLAVGYDLTADSHIEFNYLRLNQGKVLFPGQAFDINFLVTNAFEVKYELMNSDFSDRLNIDAWYNRTQFNGDNNRPSKRMQFPIYDYAGFQARTNVDSISTGTRAESAWMLSETAITTAGLDFREIRQELNEIGVATNFGINNPSNSPIPKSSTANPGLYFEHANRPIENLEVTVGSRMDFVDAELNASASSISALGLSNPQASLANLLGTSRFDQNFALYSIFVTGEYAIDDQWKLTGAAGTSQRAPNLTELYAAGPFMFLLQNGVNTVTGDPTLKPERTWQIDVGTEFNSERARFGVTGFSALVQNFITFENVSVFRVPPSFAVGQENLQFVNTDLASLAGFEAHVAYDLSSWLTPFGTMNYVAGTDLTRNGDFATIPGNSQQAKTRDYGQVRGANSGITGGSSEPLPQILPLQARVGARIHEAQVNPRWNLELAARLVDRQRRVATSLLEQPTPGFTVWDLRGTWQATPKVLLVSGVQNFTNMNFQEHLDFRPQPGAGTFRTLQPGASFYFGTEVNY